MAKTDEKKTAKTKPAAKKTQKKAGPEADFKDLSPSPGDLDGNFQTFRAAGYVYAKLLPDEETFIVSDGEKWSSVPADEFNEKYVVVPPAKVDNVEHGNY